MDGRVHTVPQAEPLGTGHALAQVSSEHRTPGPVVVLYGDTPLLRGSTLQSMLDAHLARAAAVTLLTAEMADPQGYGRVVRSPAGAFRAIVEEKDASEAQRRLREVNTGVYCFRGRDLWPALSRLENRNRAGEYYLTDVVRLIKGKVHTVPSFRSSRCSSLKDCVIGPFAQLRDSRIGHGSRIERAHLEQSTVGTNVAVGPFSRLRPGTELAEGVRVGTHTELKNARIGAGSAVPHFSYIGDAVIGANVNIGAGTITANWDGFEKHPTEIGDRA